MTNLKINHSLSLGQTLVFPLVSTYGLRHLKKKGWQNKVIGTIELFPLIGTLVSLIEKIVSLSLKNCKSSSASSKNCLKTDWEPLEIEGKPWYVFKRSMTAEAEMSPEELKEHVEDLSKEKDLNGIRAVCRNLFATPYPSFLRNSKCPTIEILIRKIYNEPSPNFDDFAELIVKAASEWKEHYREAKIPMDPQNYGEIDPEIVQFFHKNRDRKVEISHGGGFENICNFLNGKTMGYRLESPGIGLQVHPKLEYKGQVIDLSVRSDHYAKKNAHQHFDLPAIFTAKIKLKYLSAAPNFYEAGLSQKNIVHLKNVRVTQVDNKQFSPMLVTYKFPKPVCT